jgi:mannose-6-phosphate isomerase class I
LHIQKALEVMRFGKQSGGRTNPVRRQRGAVAETHFVACRYFATEQWEFTERIEAVTSRAHFDLLIFLEGSGKIRWGSDSADYAPAQVWLIPAALGEYRLTPNAATSLLRTYVPDDLTELGRRLSEQGVSEDEWSRVVHR